MRHGLLIAFVVATASGCVWINKGSDQSRRASTLALVDSDGGLAGAKLHGSVGQAGLYIGAELEVKDLALARPEPGDTRDFDGIGGTLMLRASPLGILGREHRLERWFDFGAEAGVGAGLALWDTGGVEIGSYSQAFVGGWLELGTVNVGKSGYLAVVGDIRLDTKSSAWRDDVVFGVGLAWTHRGPAEPWNIRD